MTKLALFGTFVLLMAYYYFVLRKYNSLGFRLFSLFFFVAAAVCYWWYIDYRELKGLQQSGVATDALVLQTSADSLKVRFTDQSGNAVERIRKGGISIEEFAAVHEGQTAPIVYNPRSDAFYLTSTYQRQLHDNVYILIFPGVLFLIGTGCLIFLRKFRVHAREGSLYEYVSNERGEVVLDDAKNSTTKALRAGSTLSKLLDLFR